VKQKLGVLIDRVVIHPAALVPASLVSKVQVVMLLAEAQSQHTRFQILVCFERPLLTAAWREPICANSQGDACLTPVAIWAIGEHAAAAKAVGHQA